MDAHHAASLSPAQARVLQGLDAKEARLIPWKLTRPADVLYRRGYIRTACEPRFGFVLTERGLRARGIA